MNSAEIIERRYPVSGKMFYTVECQPCLAVLNSGHHYTDRSCAEKTRAGHVCMSPSSGDYEMGGC